MPNLDEERFWAYINSTSAKGGQYKSKTAAAKISLEIEKIDWAHSKKSASRKNALFWSKYTILERKHTAILKFHLNGREN